MFVYSMVSSCVWACGPSRKVEPATHRINTIGLLNPSYFVDFNIVGLYMTALAMVFTTGGFESPWIVMILLIPSWTDLSSKLPVVYVPMD